MNVEIALDSLNPYTGVRITTFHLVYPQTIHNQVLTHRVFSRNSSSGRAISFKRNLDFPTVYPMWTKEKRGMVGERLDATISKELEIIKANDTDLDCMLADVKYWLERMSQRGTHHQHLNDFLKPFQEIHTVVTSTEWDNWFNLRMADDAKPEIQTLALAMKVAMSESRPEERFYHLPFIEETDLPIISQFLLSGRRAARISYLTENKPIEEDIESAQRMIKDKHLSPFEHAAIAKVSKHYYANFYSWQSYRHYKGF